MFSSSTFNTWWLTVEPQKFRWISERERTKSKNNTLTLIYSQTQFLAVKIILQYHNTINVGEKNKYIIKKVVCAWWFTKNVPHFPLGCYKCIIFCCIINSKIIEFAEAFNVVSKYQHKPRMYHKALVIMSSIRCL